MHIDRSAGAKGQNAVSPWNIPLSGWKDVVLRSWGEAGQDNIGLVASGVAFCAVLAMVPMLGAIVLTYGLVATPATVTESVNALTSMMPVDAARLIGEQLENVVRTSDGKKGFGLFIALGIALYGAMKGSSALITSLNIAYDENETRSFVRLNLLALGIAAGGVLVSMLAITAIAAMAALEALFPTAPDFIVILGKITSYLIVTAVGIGLAATVYRYGPDRKEAKWAWLTPGSLFASLAWLVITLGFGIYVANFGSYDATYGSLGAAIVLLTWLYLSSYVLLLGAELNCELERQTVRDTTEGLEKALGERGAFAADTVADGPNPTPKPGPGPEAAVIEDDPDNGFPVAPSHRSRTSPLKHYLAGRVVARASRASGSGKVGLFSSVLASGGLSLIGKPERRAVGFVLLIAAAGLSWSQNAKANAPSADC